MVNKSLENTSYKAIIFAAVLVVLGFFTSTFIGFLIYIAVFGALILMVGIIVFISSQLLEEKPEKQETKQ